MTSVDYWVPDEEANASSQVVAAYLRAYTAPGSLVVDPFCQSPALIVEAVASRRRAIAVSFNPLDALRTRLALTAIPTRELSAAVTRLGDSPKAGVPLREHLQRLYRTTCQHCQKPVVADYFIWERGRAWPKQVRYRCLACGDAGLRDCDEKDAAILQEVQPRGLHYWYVLDRVARGEGRDRKFAVKLLELYTPRNLYVLSNLQLKIESLFSGSALQDALRLGLLHGLEQGSKLNPVPGEPAPPHAPGLHPLPQFAEWNAWQLFEEATRQLGEQQPFSSVALAAGIQDVSSPTASPDSQKATRQAQAFVGHVSVRQLVPALSSGSVSLIWALPPPLGRTQWALPYLWSGWLYGHEVAASLWPLVKRRSSDWAWYLQAMRRTLALLQKTLQADGHVVMVGQSKGLAYHETLTLSSAGAGLRMESALYHPREPETATKPFGGLRGDYRSVWALGSSTPLWQMSLADLTARLREIVTAAAQETLQVRGEPAPFARLHCHIWEALARRGVLQQAVHSKELRSPLQWVREQVHGGLQDGIGDTLVQLWEDGPEGECLWWLTQPVDIPPLAERVEQAVYETLVALDAIATVEFMTKIYARFPGMLTPDAQWLMACLKSYGQQVKPGQWALSEGQRPEELGQAREMILYTLQDLGRRLGYEVREAPGFAMQWIQAGKETLAFAVLDSAALSPLLHAPAAEAGEQAHRLAIIAQARQDLLRLRWMRASLLRRKLVAQGWRFIQDRDLRNWASQEDIALADLDTLGSLDPLATQQRTQLSLI